MLVITHNYHTNKVEQFIAHRLEITNKPVLSSSPKDCTEVYVYNGIFNRDDSSIVISTFKPVRVLAGKFLDEASLEKEPQ